MPTAVLLHSPASLRQPAPGRTFLNREALLACAAGAVLLLVIVGASIWQAGHNEAALAVAARAEARRNLLIDLQLIVRAAESAQRGYLLTQNKIYLQPLEEAEQRAPGMLDEVARDWPDDIRAVRMRQAAVAKLAELRQTVRLAQFGQMDGAMQIVRSNVGAENMGIIRRAARQIIAEEDALVAGRLQSATHGGHMLIAIDVAGLVMILALSGLIGLGVRDYLASLRAAQEDTRRAYVSLEETNSQLDETVRHRTAALTAANEEIQRFAYIVSHDLRAPLVNIMGFTSELSQAAAKLAPLAAESPDSAVREAASSDIPEALHYIKQSTEKMDRLINAILRLSREGRRMLTPERLDMTAVLTKVAETMRHQAESQGATVTVEQLPAITADRLAVEQIFSNIVENALKYLKPGRAGVIRVSGRQEGPMTRFAVSDNGRGIAAKDFDRVFELFRRAGDQNVPGEGIGLAHVRALVRRLGGTVTCSSEVDSGSTFMITLPAIATYGRETVA